MRFLPLAVVAAALLAPFAKADKFHLGKNEQPAVEGSAPDVIAGVLIGEDDTHYHVRMVGGEVMLPKKLVRKIEKDGLTVDAIVDQERARTEALAKADAERRARQAAVRDAADRARPAGRGHAVEASLRPAEVAPAPAPSFDPVIGALRPATELSDRELLRELELAYEVTRDPRYIKLVRKLRRLR